MDITIIPHPAQAHHFKTGEPLFDDNGNKVPLWPDQRAVQLNGWLVAYIGPPPDNRLSFTRPMSVLGPGTVEQIRKKVHDEIGGSGEYQVVPELPVQTSNQYEDDD